VQRLMNRQFVLIDHSIEDSAGHYLEYARRVLGAAKAEGFRTVLAVNQRAQSLECPEADLILKPFSKTFWQNHAQSKLRTLAGFLLNKVALAIDPRHAGKFAEEVALLVRQAAVTDSDIIFLPTLGGTELVGISQYSGAETSVPARWHLLFRRDVPPSGSCLDMRNRINRWRTKAAFTVAKAHFVKGARYFYTDTEELTYRYGCLDIGKFKTLPIPIDEQLGFKKPWKQGPLIVSYLGDMRAEKGIHLLPKLIASVRRSGFSERQVHFRIQGNYPTGGATRAALHAKKRLSTHELPGVEVIEGPFDSNTYRELICRSDIILLPYSAKSYQARSSGIFSEALAAGVPTIFPQASWMEKNAIESQKAGFKNTEKLVARLIKLVQEYPENQATSLSHSAQWRARHSPQLLIHMLLESDFAHTAKTTK
jgi:glycosyltransferase involved in cell wall biosynthesis